MLPRIFLFLLVFMVACGDRQPQQSRKSGFESPEIPKEIVDPKQRSDYLVRHYWDRFDFSDTTNLRQPDITEKAFSGFLTLLNKISVREADTIIRNMLIQAEADTAIYRYFTGLYDKYLYNPNSPVRNEELYIPVLEGMVASEQLSDAQKVRPHYRLAMALKNRPGAVANDFVYTLASGGQKRMHELAAPSVLLFFNNPGCAACREIARQIESSALIDQLIKDHKLIVLAIYPDEDLEAWREHAAEIPRTWLNAYDRDQVISTENLYDLKAIPTLYLLDRDKKVLLKDATFSAVQKELLSQN